MEKIFFREIEKLRDVKTLKEFESEIRTKIIHELEVKRKTNADLNRILIYQESKLWDQIKDEGYSWLKLSEDRKATLFRVIDIYSRIRFLSEDVSKLNAQVEAIKELKDGDDGESE